MRRPNSTTTVFVYGTLLRGEPNHSLLAHAEALGPARTEPCYDLVDLGAFPALIAGGRTAIAGELYRVGPETLARLDRLEGHPDFYRRTPVRTNEGRQVETYLFPRARAGGRPRILSGDWRVRGAEAYGGFGRG
jgi:gamma-glutamylcyclotransferase (GGCT)/AIG2-like uncharacterized protein YtfP